MAEDKGVLICGEISNSRLASITQELLGAGKRLAEELGVGLSVVFLGSDVKGTAPQAIAYGADKVYLVEDPLLKDYTTDTFVAAMEEVAKELQPRILLLGQTSLGRDLAPRLAFRLGAGLSTDCKELSLDPETKLLRQTRPVYGGNALAVFVSDKLPQMATVRAKAMSPREPDPQRKGEAISLQVKLDPTKVGTKILKKVKEEVAGIKLEDAEVVVCGGRGVGSAENFKALEELAKVLKGAVGGSRPSCDNAWIPSSLQVGLTGKIVTPNLYIAVAVSGASQHMAGCSSSKNIVAINRDPEANIFKEARFGVVGDYKQVLPAFTQKVKELLAT